MLLPYLVQSKTGISYVIVGDFTYIKNLEHANAAFDSIENLKANAVPGSKEDFDFFVTVGDNLYPVDELEPTE